MWSTPSVVRRSENDLASGHMDHSKRHRGNSQNHSGLGMATFIQADDDADERHDVDGDLKYNKNIFATTTIVMSNSTTNTNSKSSKQNSVWDDSREQGNDSEEELHTSKDTISSGGKRVTPKSFLPTNGSR